MDIKAAYLNAKLEEEIYVDIPEGDKNYNSGKYWILNKAIKKKILLLKIYYKKKRKKKFIKTLFFILLPNA